MGAQHIGGFIAVRTDTYLTINDDHGDDIADNERQRRRMNAIISEQQTTARRCGKKPHIHTLFPCGFSLNTSMLVAMADVVWDDEDGPNGLMRMQCDVNWTLAFDATRRDCLCLCAFDFFHEYLRAWHQPASQQLATRLRVKW